MMMAHRERPKDCDRDPCLWLEYGAADKEKGSVGQWVKILIALAANALLTAYFIGSKTAEIETNMAWMRKQQETMVNTLDALHGQIRALEITSAQRHGG